MASFDGTARAPTEPKGGEIDYGGEDEGDTCATKKWTTIGEVEVAGTASGERDNLILVQ